MFTKSRKFWNLVVVLALLLPLFPARPLTAARLMAATETLGGTAAEGNLKIEVRETGGIGVARYTNSAWRTQVYVYGAWGEESAKGSRLEHDGAPSGYRFWDSNMTYFVDGADPTIESNTKLDAETVQTVWTVPSARITQTVSYIDGTDYIHYVWQIENTGGAALSNVKFLHAADTCLSGPDSGSDETSCDFMSDFGDGFWVASNQAVGVRQVDGSDEIRLYFQGVTAPAAYDSRATWDTISNFSDGQLQDGLEDGQDHGYGLQWDNASLAAGDVWEIDAYERFVLAPASGDVIVIAPSETTIGEGGAGDAVYTVSNLGGSAANVTLSTGTDPAGWSASVTDPASGSATIPAGGEVDVTVHIEPTGSSEGDSGTVTLTVDDGSNTSSDVTTVQVGAGSGPATCTSTGVGSDWSAAATWDCGHVPDATEHVVVGTGHTVTVDQDVTLGGDLDVQGTLDASNCTYGVTLTGSAAQTLTGNPLVFCRLTVNKDNAGDTATVSGQLQVTQKLMLTRGTLVSAADDYGEVETGANGVLQLGGDITVSGDWTHAGTLTPGAYMVTFDGTALQTLGGSAATAFYRWVITAAAKVFVATPPTAADSVENNGVISQTQTVNNATVNFLQISTDRYRGVDIVTTDNLGDVSVAISGNRAQCTNDPASGPYRDRCFRVNTGVGSTNTDMTFYTTAVEDDVDNDEVNHWQDVSGTMMWVALGTTYSGGDGDPCTVTSAALQLFVGDNYFLIGDELGDAPNAVNVSALAARGGVGLAALGLLVLGAVAVFVPKRR